MEKLTKKRERRLNFFGCVKMAKTLRQESLSIQEMLSRANELQRTSQSAGVKASTFLSEKNKEALYKKIWMTDAWLNDSRLRNINEFVSFIEYEPTPEVLGNVFSSKFWDQGYKSALEYFYSELVGKVFPLPVYIAESLAKRVDLHTWNGVSILKKESLKLIRTSPGKVYLFGTKYIKEMAAFMSFIPVTE